MAAPRYTLLPHQIEPTKRLVDLMNSRQVTNLIGDTGVGKTWIVAETARRLGLKAFVVAPVSALESWRKVLPQVGVQLVDAISYESLRGMKGRPLKHKWLTQHLTTESKTSKKLGNQKTEHDVVSFQPTPALIELAKSGVLLIFDECHKVKNMSAGYKAAEALITGIENAPSRAVLISATPFDKVEMTTHHLKLIGAITHRDLGRYIAEKRLNHFIGAHEVIVACHSVDPTKTQEIVMGELGVTAEDVTKIIDTKQLLGYGKLKLQELMYALYVGVLATTYTAWVKGPVREIDAKNGYYNMAPNDVTKLCQGISELGRAANLDAGGVVSWAGIGRAMTTITAAKLPLLERLARDQLEENPRCKVVVYLERIEEGLLPLAEMLKEFKPLLMYGATSPSQRKANVEAFQRHDTQSRLMLCHYSVGGVSIDLHDTHGSFPRYAFMVPGYKVIDTHQASGRFAREGSKSEAVIRMVYGKCGRSETGILNALARKSETLRSLTGDADARKYPGEYEIIIEEDGGNDL